MLLGSTSRPPLASSKKLPSGILLTPWALFFLRPEGPDFLALSFILDSGVPGPLAGGILLDLESSIQG